ncbi:MAG: hypothetical protein IPJ08_11440 [Burkholderiales bacterium]|nr:hypothetical protein [Burkholderiales bacterium]
MHTIKRVGTSSAQMVPARQTGRKDGAGRTITPNHRIDELLPHRWQPGGGALTD